MATTAKRKGRARAGTLQKIETDPAHHLAGPFLPQTPFESSSESGSRPPTPLRRPRSPPVNPWNTTSKGFWNDLTTFRWIVVPSSSFKLWMFPVILWANWEVLAPYVANGISNPFAHIIFISHRVPDSPPDNPLYQKGYFDLVFIAYYIIVWSWFRQTIILYVCWPVTQYFGIKKEAKLARFGEQGYAMIYFAISGAWGYRIMSRLPTWWYNTSEFWIGYPHWEMVPELKSYYLLQAAYWCQQLLVLGLGLEKPRKDYAELIAHHFVTLWLVGWSYLINLTYIGNAVYMSMDIPDTFLAFSKLLNYMRFDRAKIVAVVVFCGVWTYFRHYLNIVMLWSVWNEFDLMPETSKRWYPADGVWLTWWMKYQIFVPILLLQFLNLYWYFLILRIVWRAISTATAEDDRSDDEDEDEDEFEKREKKN